MTWRGNMSQVEVIVPCYKYAGFLRQGVESALTQEGVEVRVLILDDASQDDSETVGRQLAAQDARVEYRRHVSNRGHIETYNEGIDWLTGDYCLLLSADDMLVPGALARAAAVMDDHSEVGLTYGRAVLMSRPDPVPDCPVVTPDAHIRAGREFIREECETAVNVVPTPTAIGRTAIQKMIGHYRLDLPHAGDMEMWLRYAAFSSVTVIRSYQAYQRIHTTNMSHGYRGSRNLEQVWRTFHEFFKQFGGRLSETSALRRSAAQAVLREAFDGAYQAVQRGDVQEYRAFTALAAKIDPTIPYRGAWLRLQAKRFLGQRALSWLRRVRWALRLGH